MKNITVISLLVVVLVMGSVAGYFTSEKSLFQSDQTVAEVEVQEVEEVVDCCADPNTGPTEVPKNDKAKST